MVATARQRAVKCDRVRHLSVWETNAAHVIIGTQSHRMKRSLEKMLKKDTWNQLSDNF